MKIADGPVALELNGCRQDRDEERYIRWRDYHSSYPHGQAVVYVHQLSAIAGGANPYEVFSDGDFETNHTGEVLPDVDDAHKVKDLNGRDNLEVMRRRDHFTWHRNEEETTEMADNEQERTAGSPVR